MYTRVEAGKLNKSSFILAALTTGAIKFNFFLFMHILVIVGIKLVCLGADPKKPYSKLRCFLMEI